MLSPKLEERLREAKLALDKATSEDIIKLCKQYLTLLAEYRIELYRLPDTLDLNPRSRFATSLEGRATRKKVRAAIERTTSEREWAERLIISFNAVNGYGAVETFNRQ